ARRARRHSETTRSSRPESEPTYLPRRTRAVVRGPWPRRGKLRLVLARGGYRSLSSPGSFPPTEVASFTRNFQMSSIRSVWRWFRGGGKRRAPGHVSRLRPRPLRSRLSLEPLEDRCLPSVTLFPIPSPNTEPEGITRGPDGNLYFAEIHAIGRITPGGQITEFRQGLSPASEPVEITAGPDGNVCFTDPVTH